MEYQVLLTEELQQASSTETEMVGQLVGLRLNAEELKGCSVRWICDNWAVSIINRVGSMRPRLQEIAVEIWKLCREHMITVEWDWKPRTCEEVQYADRLSKDYDFSDFSLSDEDFRVLEREFGPFSCDYFASSSTFRMIPFMSRFRCEGSSGADAFTASWWGNGYFHPPVHRIVDTVRYAKAQRVKGVLITPYWPWSSFWAYIAMEEGVVERPLS